MDAHLFRRLCDALLPRLLGARMEKIHAPAADVMEFCLFGGKEGDRKRFLLLKAGRQNSFLFSSPHHISTNAQPPAHVMRLRKYLSGKRVVHALCEWTKRILWLGFSGEAETWLKLDMREGASLSFVPPSPPGEPIWPDASILLRPQEEWRAWEVLTPALRRTLTDLNVSDAAALLVDLQLGGGDVFLYECQGKCRVSAWPLPDFTGRNGWHETVFSDPVEAMEKAGDDLVLHELSERARQNAVKPLRAESARLDRLLKKLSEDEHRLCAMREKQADALLLQSQLYKFDKNAHLAHVTVSGPDGDVMLHLNPKRTVYENMAELFHQSGRGKRGLEHLARRREAVRSEKERVEQAMLGTGAAVSGVAPPASAPADGKARALPGQVQVFRSSDGFLILRGRSAKGNGQALKMAAPHDYWLHTAEGPSAHVIIRRNHAGHIVPERTMREAGILAALKSWQKDQRHALIQYSLAKYIHPMKNASAGMVRIDRSEGSFPVDIDPGLEAILEKS